MGKEVDRAYKKWDENEMNMRQLDQDFEFRFIDLLEIHQLVKGIDVNKASGIEGIGSKILKDCFIICEYELASMKIGDPLIIYVSQKDIGEMHIQTNGRILIKI